MSDVIRLESFDSDIKRIFKNLGVWNGRSEFPMLNRNRSGDERDYRKYYTTDTSAIIENAFSSDISRFGYDF